MLKLSARISVLGSLLALGVFAACAPGGAPPPPARSGGTLTETGTALDRTSFVTGSTATYIVPAGFYVTKMTAHAASADANGGTVTITPSGRNTLVPCNEDGGTAVSATCADAGPPIAVPAGASYTIEVPVLRGTPDELSDGTTFVFTGTDSYVITLYRYYP